MLHRRNILHRDIKPENLHLGADGELRLLDFGLAYCPGLSEKPSHELPGTPGYIAPEAFEGQPPQVLVHRSMPDVIARIFPTGWPTVWSRPSQSIPDNATRPPNNGCWCWKRPNATY